MADVTYGYNQYQTDQDTLNRQKAIADALQAQSLQAPQGQMVSGHYVAPGLGGAIGQIGDALLGKYIRKTNDEGQTALNQKFMQSRQAQLGAFQTQFQNDPHGAVLAAMSSNDPLIQAIGKQEGAGLSTQKDVMATTGATVGSRVAAASGGNPNLGALKDVPIVKEVNGQVVNIDPATGQPTATGDYRDKYGQPTTLATGPDGKPVLGQVNLSGGKDETFPGGGVTVNTGEQLKKAAIPGLEKALTDARTSKIQAIQTNATADKFLKLIQDPNVPTGALAGPRAVLQNFGNTLFPGDVAGASKAQQAIATSADLALAASHTAQGQGSISDYERGLFERASKGDLNMGREALTALGNGLKKAAAIQVHNADELNANVSADPDLKFMSKLYQGGNTAPGDIPTLTPEAPPQTTNSNIIPNSGSGPKVIKFENLQ